MNNQKPIWILVPMRSEESKKKFKEFVESKVGKTFKVPSQYEDGTVMLLVSPDLKSYGLINFTCAAAIDFHTQGVDDFISKYDDFKNRYDIAMTNIANRFQEPSDIEDESKVKGYYILIMPDGDNVGVKVYEGENKQEKMDKIVNHWFEVTSKDPFMFGHKKVNPRCKVCPKCGGELHYKYTTRKCYTWCINCHERFIKDR